MWVETAADFLTSPGIIVVAAAALQTIAYIFSNQLTLRLFLLLGTSLYLLYYFVAADDPLWPAIFGTACIGTTSIYGFLRTLANRSTFSISKAHLSIYETIGDIEPGAFRQLMKTAEIKTFDGPEILTELGVVPDHVFYVLEGEVDVCKNDYKFTTGPTVFIGEVSIIGGFEATATVHSRAGSKAVVWDRHRLLEAMGKNVHFRIAVESLFSKDMALKLAQSAKMR
ncbi:hypothetical protein C1J03_19380 [Sulfitobacter sp. SK012]|uniref:cyclic nucleotide-binding domain-containing protein n=1 Tax=Sulfitobacter sp. SK012 TaxID=1389005 RepID=UPI000E0A86B2|nr:cyclic nucleotide-binding domain-containing protein [Sulfitobacter sp. SK012]AXI47971.1 hypothetical protein C1J03_19380 [Sulfitobacter sp. SK012]